MAAHTGMTGYRPQAGHTLPAPVAARWWLAPLGAALLTAPAARVAPVPDKIGFNQFIRPILADNCFTCHGFDASQRKAGLRLDTGKGETAVLKDGRQAIKPGDVNGRKLWRRVNAADPAVRMPPWEADKQLKPEEIKLLGRWIGQGAVYEKHWAFVPPVRPELPAVRQTNWPRNDVDRFILARLESQHLQPSPEAAKAR